MQVESGKTPKTVLIIDDDAAIREVMQDVLELQGYRILTAGDGKEGFNLLCDTQPRPSVILLDMMMPGVNGWQFLDYQRSHPDLSQVPVIICSAYRESAKAVKPAAVIEKPIQLNKLLEAVKAFCA